MTFGEAIREARGRRTLREVADALGVSVPYLHDVEHGRRAPLSDERTRLLADFLEVDEETRSEWRIKAILARGYIEIGGLDAGVVRSVIAQLDRARNTKGCKR